MAATTYYFSSLDDLIVKAVEHVGALEAQQLRERVAGLSRRRRGAEATVDVLVDLLVGDDPESTGERAVDLAVRALHRVRASARSARGSAANSAAADRRGRQGRRAVAAGRCAPSCVPALVCAVDGAVVAALVDDGDGPRSAARATLIDVIDVLAPITAPISRASAHRRSRLTPVTVSIPLCTIAGAVRLALVNDGVFTAD